MLELRVNDIQMIQWAAPTMMQLCTCVQWYSGMNRQRPAILNTAANTYCSIGLQLLQVPPPQSSSQRSSHDVEICKGAPA